VTLPHLEQFVADAETFLADHLPRRRDETSRWGQGSDDVAAFPEADPESEAAELDAARRWRRVQFDAGYGYLTGKPEHGGRGLPSSYQRAYDDVEGHFEIPGRQFFTIGLGMVAPTIAAHGTDVVKQRYLRPLHRGDLIGCQLFSEPEAGSDLASLRTTAERDGDSWVITGQKLWTSVAHYSHIGEIIARTDPTAPKHAGLTAFIVDMTDPSITVRPLRQMTGGAGYNEVFLDQVCVPDDHRLGDVDRGWAVAISTLMSEREMIGDQGAGGSGLATRYIEMVRNSGRADEPLIRQSVADLWIHQTVARLSNARANDSSGGERGALASLEKLAGALNMRRLSQLASLVLGAHMVVDTDTWGTYSWSRLVLGEPALHLAGGTDEIIRNVIAERILGLPK
jgi:alkylation response protein AidB-like acyl-CoA dehydrogenase